MKVIKSFLSCLMVNGGDYFIESDKPHYLLSYKHNNDRRIWASSIQSLFEFNIDEVEFVYNDYLTNENDVVVVEFNSLESFKEEHLEYFV